LYLLYTLDATLGYHVRVYIGYNAPSNDGEERTGHGDDNESSFDGNVGGTSKKSSIGSKNRWVDGRVGYTLPPLLN
jgi:hypothetical protein